MQEERTSAIGLLLFGKSYLDSAEFLESNRHKGKLKLRFDAPIFFLVGHALELMFKAYLRSTGNELNDLKKEGHGLRNLLSSAEAEGLQLGITRSERDHLAALDEIHGSTENDLC